MHAIRAIAVNTVREAVRDKILYLFVGFAVVVLFGSKVFGLLTVGDEEKVILDLGLAGIQVSCALIAIMMSLVLISREIDSRTVYLILAKPVRRWQFLLGKYLGLVSVIGVNLIAMGALLMVLSRLYGGRFEPRVVVAVAMIFLEMLVLSACATLFSVVTRPMLGAILTLAVFVIGHLSEDLWMLTRHLSGMVGRIVISILYYAIPNLERFDFKTETVHHLAIPWPAVGWAVVYGVGYSGLVLILSAWRFEGRDLG